MPCDAVRTIKMDFKVANREILIAGLKAAGFEVHLVAPNLVAIKNGVIAQIGGGKIEVNEYGKEMVNEIKQAYAMEAVRTAARRFGWSMMQDRQDAKHYTAQKR